jgi:hypothetical protein
MAYIGREPQIGNFQVCDAISTVNNQAAYTMQVGVVDVSPESANHMIVSLNGVIQKPTDAYTVAGSTITFAANLVTGDVIDFIQILGNVLDLGVPSDATVSTAKIVDDAVTLAKMASGTDGNIISYDASGNPVAVATGSAGQVLTSAGAGAPPTFAAAGGITEADAWRITANAVFSGAGASDVTANWERADTSGFDKIGTGLSESSGIFSFPSTGYYYINYFSSMTATSATTYMAIQLMTTPNNSSYSTASSNYGNVIASGQTNNSASFILKVTDITNIKFKFQSERAGTYTLLGSTSESRSGFSCVRLGDI